jgi:4-oxalomesaconate hydratase
MGKKKLLVIGAHSADFVWRAAGTIALVTSQGGSATVIALSYGERGESGELWKDPGQTVENVKRIRHEQASAAAEILGAEFRCFDLGDYPLTITDEVMTQLADLFREMEPHIALTHTPVDPFNPDHPVASQAVQHQPELCEFTPNTFLDITPVMEQKRKAMECMKAQSYLQGYYAELASRRGNHARRIAGMEEVKYAEALQRTLPWVVKSL